jgi:hypothetical protein
VFWTRYYYKEHKLKLRAPQLLAAFEQSRSREAEASLDWGSDDDNDTTTTDTTASTAATASTADTTQTTQVCKPSYLMTAYMMCLQ